MTFVKGKSGNPKGRPKGQADARASINRLLRESGGELLEIAINKARNGDSETMRFLLGRLLPKNSIENYMGGLKIFGSPDHQMEQVLGYLESETINLAQAQAFADIIKKQADIKSGLIPQIIEKLQGAGIEINL
jgi:hypothetical protein